MWEKWSYCNRAQIQTGCASTCLVVMYKLTATLCKAAVWSVRGLAISVRVESGMCTETPMFLAWESVVSMRIVCVVNFHLLHKWALKGSKTWWRVTYRWRMSLRPENWPLFNVLSLLRVRYLQKESIKERKKNHWWIQCVWRMQGAFLLCQSNMPFLALWQYLENEANQRTFLSIVALNFS